MIILTGIHCYINWIYDYKKHTPHCNWRKVMEYRQCVDVAFMVWTRN